MTNQPYTGRGRVGGWSRQPIRPICWVEVVPDYRQGRTTPEIAGKIGISEETVRRALIFWNEPRRPRGAGAVPPERNPGWRGGRSYKENKYWAAKIATYCLGRALCRGEIVHHIDGNTWNNEPENLIVFPSNVPHLQTHWQLSRLPQPVPQAVAIQIALGNGGTALQRPAALSGWKLDTVPPVRLDGKKLRMLDPPGFQWGHRTTQRLAPRQ